MSSTESIETTIPIIDLSSPSLDIAQEVLNAASTYGFLFVKNDGVTIDTRDIDDMFILSKRYFSQPKEEKIEYAIHSETAGGKNKGWVQMQGEALDPDSGEKGDPKEAFNISPPQPSLQPLPPLLSDASALIKRFQSSCHTLCTQILALLGTALKIQDPNYFATRHDQSLGPSGTIFRLLYYPSSTPPIETEPIPGPTNGTASESEKEKLSILAGAHSDYGSLTLLFRLPGQAGLEILAPPPTSSSTTSTTRPTWQPVPVNPSPDTLPRPPILVNIGDLLSFWTNGLLKSTVHRVAFTTSASGKASAREERYSMAYFCHPRDEVELESVESDVISAFGEAGAEEMKRQWGRVGIETHADEGAKRRVLTAREHLDRRLKVTYGLDE